MLYHHSYYGVSPLPLPNVISFTTTISTTSASLYHSCILDHCFFGLPLFVWTTTTLWIATIFLDYRCIYVSNKAVCDANFRFLHGWYLWCLPACVSILQGQFNSCCCICCSCSSAFPGAEFLAKLKDYNLFWIYRKTNK